MGQVEETASVHGDVAQVWSFLTDPKNFPKYVDGYVHGHVTSPRKGLGERYEWHAAIGPLRLRCTEEVIAWREPEHVGYSGSMAGVSFRSAMTLAPRGSETALGVQVTFTVPLRLGGRATDYLVLTPLVRNSVQRSIAQIVAQFAS